MFRCRNSLHKILTWMSSNDSPYRINHIPSQSDAISKIASQESSRLFFPRMKCTAT